MSELKDILEQNGILCDELVVYETRCSTYTKEEAPKKGAKIIFSSPSTIECFFENFAWDESYKAIAIGKTTAAHLPKYIKPFVAGATSLEECIKLARNI